MSLFHVEDMSFWNGSLDAAIPLQKRNLRSHGTLSLVPTYNTLAEKIALDCLFFNNQICDISKLASLEKCWLSKLAFHFLS
jgi:hypothetical protein